MTQYSRQQEDRAERKLIEVGFRLIEDTGRRKTGRGDKYMEHVDTGLRLTVDNKSTRGSEGIRLQRADLEKIRKEAFKDSIGAITFSFYKRETVWIALAIPDLEGILY